jgi:hypothetical protein
VSYRKNLYVVADVVGRVLFLAGVGVFMFVALAAAK